VLRGALSFFLIIVGIGIAYVCFRLGGMLRRMSITVVKVTDEVVPILSRAQTTVDGINLELQRVDEIMVSAVNATKGAEKTVTSLSHAVTAPVRKASSITAAAKEAVATFRAKRAETAGAAQPTDADAHGPPPRGDMTVTDAPLDRSRAESPPPMSEITVHEHGSNNGDAPELPVDIPLEVKRRVRGPSLSQISWALPKRRQ
jgi:hypothetical protein